MKTRPTNTGNPGLDLLFYLTFSVRQVSVSSFVDLSRMIPFFKIRKKCCEEQGNTRMNSFITH